MFVVENEYGDVFVRTKSEFIANGFLSVAEEEHPEQSWIVLDEDKPMEVEE